MAWHLEGKRVKGNYYGVMVEGVVLSSRVKYGGGVQHTVKIDPPIMLKWRSEPADTLLLNDTELTEVLDV